MEVLRAKHDFKDISIRRMSRGAASPDAVEAGFWDMGETDEPVDQIRRAACARDVELIVRNRFDPPRQWSGDRGQRSAPQSGRWIRDYSVTEGSLASWEPCLSAGCRVP